MDRYEQTFSQLKKEKRIGFCPFAVLGDPDENKCLERIKIYLDSKPDFLELGIPFSDPIADGPVVQAADERSLMAGATPKSCFGLIKKIRSIANSRDQNIPIGVLTYSNIVLQYGIQNFYKDLKKASADSLLIADVPLEEIAQFSSTALKNNICQIFIVSEYTDPERLKKINKIARGFLYVVSTLGVTGVRGSLPKSTNKLLSNLQKKTKLPLMVGFGISNANQITVLKKTKAAGFIVGSALVKTPIKKLATSLKKFSTK